MKLSKKKVFALALAVCLLATLSLGTLAWFTAEDEVTNNFYVGDSTTDPDDVFGVDVWEEVDTDRDPETELEVVGKGDTTENTADYDLILPGEAMTKKPYLTNTGKHPQFARAIVTVSDGYTLMEAMMGYWGDASKFLAGTDSTKWTLDQILFTEDHEIVYIYYYNEVLEPGATTAPVFDAVVSPTGPTLEQAQSIDNFQVNVLGQVIQSEHLGDPENPGEMITDAKSAFTLYFDEAGTTAGIPDAEILGRGGENIVFEEVVDTAIVMDQEPGDAYYLTNATASVNKEVILIDDAVMNATIVLQGGEFTMKTADAKLVRAEGGGGLVVYILEPVTVHTFDGQTIQITPSNYSEYSDLFENVLVLA